MNLKYVVLLNFSIKPHINDFYSAHMHVYVYICICKCYT